jgi:hypothetical protein
MKDVRIHKLHDDASIRIDDQGQVFYVGKKQIELWPGRSVLFNSGISFVGSYDEGFFLFDVSDALKRSELFTPFNIFRFNGIEFKLRLNLDLQERLPVIISTAFNTLLGSLIYVHIKEVKFNF